MSQLFQGNNESEEVDDDQSVTRSNPQEMVDETVAEVIPCTNSEANTDVKLITQEIKEWQDAMGD